MVRKPPAKPHRIQADRYYEPPPKRKDFSKNALALLECWGAPGGTLKGAKEALGLKKIEYAAAEEEIYQRLGLGVEYFRASPDWAVTMAVVNGLLPRPPESKERPPGGAETPSKAELGG